MKLITVVTLAGYGIAVLTLVHLLQLRKRPASTLAWAWAILLFPYIGSLCYWLFGNDRMRRKRLKRRQGFKTIKEVRRKSRLNYDGSPVLPEDEALAKVLSRLNGIPPTSVNEQVLLPSAELFYDRLIERVNAAKHHVHVQFYIWRADSAGERLRDALVAAAKRGVAVRVLVDEIGSLMLGSSHFKPLTDAGGEFSWFMTLDPRRHRYLLNLRNHRKIQIIDGKICFVGGMNVGREYMGLDPAVGPWKDLQAEYTGPLATALQECFADDWFFATGKKIDQDEYYPEIANKGRNPALILAGGPDDPSEPMQKSMAAILNHARSRVWLTTGYFVPNGITLAALQLCAARGVDVRLLITAKSDHPALYRIGRSYYDELMNAGVKIFEFSEAVHHMKAGVIDDDWFLVGSANIDNRSMRVNFELSVLVRDPETAAKMVAGFENDFAACEAITPETFAARPKSEKAWEAILRPFSPLL